MPIIPSVITVAFQALDNLVKTYPNNSHASTFLVAIVGSIRILIEAITISQRCTSRETAILQRILEISSVLASSLEGEDKVEDTFLIFHVTQFLNILNQLSQPFMAQVKRGKFLKLVMKSTSESTIRSIEDSLEHCMNQLELRVRMANETLAATISTKPFKKEQSELAAAIMQHQEEQSTLIKSRLSRIDRQEFGRLSTHAMPPSPQVFYGRSKAESHLIQGYQSSRPSYAAILGAGGIGKTSLGLTVANRSEIVDIFGEFRWFLSCEAIIDANGLISAIASIFGIDETKLIPQLITMARALNTDMLLMIDNFETTWEPCANREAVETVLKGLISVPRLSLLLTLRGVEYPLGVPWARPFLPPLHTLDLESARKTFLRISDIENEEGIDDLLNAVECLPLAVTLMATQAQYRSCVSLRDSWVKQKTAMLTRGYDSRLSSLDVSINVSLNSERLTRYPEAISLLQVLSILPDGVTEAYLTEILDGMINVAGTSSALVQVALAYRDDQLRLRCLTPIREYIQAYWPIAVDLLRPVFNHYRSLVTYAHTTRWSTAGVKWFEIIVSQGGNIDYVFIISMDFAPLHEAAIDAALETSRLFESGSEFLNRCTSLIQKALSVSQKNELAVSRAHCVSQMVSITFKSGGSQKEVQRHFDDASNVYRRLYQKDRLCDLLTSYADNLSLTDNYAQAKPLLDEASTLLSDNAQFNAVTLCIVRSRLLRLQDKVLPAIDCVKQCMRKLDLSNHQILEARLWHELGQGHGILDNNSDVLICLDRGRALLKGIGGPHERKYWSFLGHLYLDESRLSDAEDCINKAIELSPAAQIGTWLSAMQELSRGKIALARGEYEQAITIFHICLHNFASHPWLHESCKFKIGFAELLRGNIAASAVYFHGAELYQPFKVVAQQQIAIHLAHCAQYMAAERHLLCLRRAVLATILSCRLGSRLWPAISVQGIGDAVLAMCHDLETAKSCYMFCLRAISHLGNRREMGDALTRLGVVHLLENSRHEAAAVFAEGQRWYGQAQHHEGWRYCEARLSECSAVTVAATFEDLPPFPTASFLSLV